MIQSLKIEVIAPSTSLSQDRRTFRSRPVNRVMLRTYDIDEMLGTKPGTAATRPVARSVRPRRALTGSSLSHVPDPDRIVHAFRKYMEAEGSTVDADAFRRDLDRKLKMDSFRNDMQQMTRAGVSFDIDAAAERVRRELLDVLDRRTTPTQKSE